MKYMFLIGKIKKVRTYTYWVLAISYVIIKIIAVINNNNV